MGKIYKTYELEEVLSLYINKNGILYDSTKKDRGQFSNENNNKEFEEFIELISKEEEKDIDIQIEKDFLDDVDIAENESTEELNRRIKRYQKIVKILKQKYNYKCQLCGYTFPMDNGSYYCEAHHIQMLSRDGSQHPENVIILCANHHRKFHYAKDNIIIGKLIDGKRVIKIGNEEFVVQF
ncbi:HNH endonuclease [Clostridium botulinum]|uniref:HNH endonuclease n=1 Tax=Clostridium botulinum TaxID=1491 RepID=A0A6B4G179_CLOBO|nr:HNH endonuclease signature motif containing protein [Clostridium botulinum]MBN3382931.1 HNH endonuclease [Clostridium botulinum]NFF90078.1 HNH endonuclease [Clostridium botulinum]NFG16864.1 HNH endonuclease [Clostridium botulinum]NFG30629.1 HNH endonuclease [Clostridium botulinum]NFG33772.1 HNH endonuclease [Clostridium botulinum]